MLPKDYYNWGESSEFFTYLRASGLSQRSVQEYINYHLKFYETFGDKILEQKDVNAFVDRYNNQPARTFMKHLITFRKIQGIEIPKRKGAAMKKQKRYISPQEIEQMVSYFAGKQEKYALMLMLSYECALRRKELLSIKPIDFEWEEWKKNTAQNGVLKISHLGAKRRRERFVIVPAILMQALYSYGKQKRLKKSESFWGIKIKSSKWHQKFKEAGRAIGKDYTLHELRFSKATYWHKAGIDILRIKERLGHSNLSTTQLYINSSSRDEAERWKQEGLING